MRTTWWRRVLAVLVISAGLITGGAGAALAECKPEAVPNYAGSGLPGDIDTPVENPSTTKYGTYGWGGYRWYTCDLGMGPEVTNDPVAVGDTWIGNVELGGATTLGAVMTQLHQWVADPGEIMAPIDDTIEAISDAIKTATWEAYAPALIILAGALIVLGARTGDVRKAMNNVVAVLITMLVIAWVFTPRAGQPGSVAAAQTFDGVVNEIVGGVDRSILTSTGVATEGVSDDEARGATFADLIIYPIWSRGAIGAQSGKDADKLAEALYQGAAVSYADAGAAKADDYRDKYDEAASQIKDQNEGWYKTLQGKGYNRAGQGFLALAMMVIISWIRIPAELLVLIGLLVMRLAVMFAPIFALAGILETTRPYAKSALKMTIASVVNVAIFGIIASVHTAIVSVVVVHNKGEIIKSLFIVLSLTVIVWMLSKPFRSPTKLATGADAASALEGAASAPSNAIESLKGLVGMAAGSAMGSYIGSRRGSEAGIEDAERPPARERQEQWSRIADGGEDPVEYYVVPPYVHPSTTSEHPELTAPERKALTAGPEPSMGELPPGPSGRPDPDGVYALPPVEERLALPQHVTYPEDQIFIPDLIITPEVDPDWREPIRVDGRAQLIEPEFDAAGNLTYDIFIPDMPTPNPEAMTVEPIEPDWEVEP